MLTRVTRKAVKRHETSTEAVSRIFVRQPFTESGDTEKGVIQKVLEIIGSFPVDVVTGLEAQSQETFRHAFEQGTGKQFTPQNFRANRLGMLESADAMIVIRTSLSESGAFEVAYNIFGGRRVPMLFAIWKHAPIKTTLLRDLDEFCPAKYVTFEDPEELRGAVAEFLRRVGRHPAERRVAFRDGTRFPLSQAETIEAAELDFAAALGHASVSTTGRYLHARPTESSSFYLPD